MGRNCRVVRQHSHGPHSHAHPSRYPQRGVAAMPDSHHLGTSARCGRSAAAGAFPRSRRAHQLPAAPPAPRGGPDPGRQSAAGARVSGPRAGAVRGPGIGTPHVGTPAGKQCIQCSSAPRTEVLCQSQRPRIRSNRLADLLALSRSASPAAFLVHRLPGLTNAHKSASTTPEQAKLSQSSSPCLASQRPYLPHTHGSRQQATPSHERLEAPITER